jgi:hypothetical protein
MRAKPGDRPTPLPIDGELSPVKYAQLMRHSRLRMPTPPFGKPNWECTKCELMKTEAWHLKVLALCGRMAKSAKADLDYKLSSDEAVIVHRYEAYQWALSRWA